MLGVTFFQKCSVLICVIQVQFAQSQRVIFETETEERLEPVSAFMSSAYGNHEAVLCIDGDKQNFCHTLGTDHTSDHLYPWITLDLGTSAKVSRITIFNRLDCCGERLKDVDVRISNDPPTTAKQPFKGGTSVGFFDGPGHQGEIITFEADTTGRYIVIIQNSEGKFNAADQMNIAEVEVYGYPSTGTSLFATCDNAMRIYFDGVLQFQDADWPATDIYQWTRTTELVIPSVTKVLGIECQNIKVPEGNYWGILASTEDGVVTDESWSCTSNQNLVGWAELEFEDTEGDFSAASTVTGPSTVVSRPNISPSAQWIWSQASEFASCKKILGCQSGWSGYKFSLYRIFTSRLSWYEAKSACEGENGNLASIPDIETNNFIANLISCHHDIVWIGGFQASGSEPWQWTDQSSWAFENWYSGEPNGISENCIEMIIDGDDHGKWNDITCSGFVTRAYVCEKPRNYGNKVARSSATVILSYFVLKLCLNALVVESSYITIHYITLKYITLH
eukprot:GFUD01081324.1.p1 GENE.GFUD01081324.1~~GFUD01081324.1.p1  ORF type:complete len:513 (+),score=54.68 GFUD01081324.1:23-1540(+)